MKRGPEARGLDRHLNVVHGPQVGAGHDDSEIGLVTGYREALDLIGSAGGFGRQGAPEVVEALLPVLGGDQAEPGAIHLVEEVEAVPALCGHRAWRGSLRMRPADDRAASGRCESGSGRLHSTPRPGYSRVVREDRVTSRTLLHGVGRAGIAG